MHQGLTIFLLLLVLNSCTKPTPSPTDLLSRSCRYLWSQQGVDGGWHSQTHGILKGGESLTAFILFNLLEVPDSIYPKDPRKVKMGLHFIRKHVNEKGVLGLSDPDILDYPNYSTSYALRTLHTYGTGEDLALRRNMQNYLIAQQYLENRGITSDHPAYGGWGFGEVNIPQGTTGHIDLSHTRRVLEALCIPGIDRANARSKATGFLFQLQKIDSTAFDGGFFSSNVVLGTNKGATMEDPFGSYATASCDGLMALLASGLEKNHFAVQSSLSWLLENSILEYPQGIPKDNPNQWHRVMFYYHLAVRAEAYQAMDVQNGWQEQMIRLLAKRQQADGSFFNPLGGPNKEDDPLLATTLAVATLTQIVGK